MQNEIDCVICFEKIKNHVITKCNHLFCDTCLITHLKENNTCPLCREICDYENIINQIVNKRHHLIMEIQNDKGVKAKRYNKNDIFYIFSWFLIISIITVESIMVIGIILYIVAIVKISINH